MAGVLRREDRELETQEEGRVRRKAEIGMMYLQVSEHQGLPVATRTQKGDMELTLTTPGVQIPSLQSCEKPSG